MSKTPVKKRIYDWTARDKIIQVKNKKGYKKMTNVL